MTLREMAASAYNAKKTGNYDIVSIAIGSGYDPDDERDTALFLAAYARTAITAIEGWDGKPVGRSDTKHPVSQARDRLAWLIALGASEQVDEIKGTIQRKMAAARK